jgi:mRNA interferase MazF
MRRGEIWTVAGGKDYAGKPRPVVILQDDRFDATASVTICAFTTDPTDAPLFRLLIEPNAKNGLRAPCRLMVDKITTVPKSKMGARMGRLNDEDVLRLNRAVVVFLGLAGPAAESQRVRSGRSAPRAAPARSPSRATATIF